MSVRSRLAFATGAAGLVGSALLLAGRFEGSVVVALLFVGAARVATPASLADAGPGVALGATRALLQQAWFAPAWVLIVAVGVLRAGSPALSDARGANAVAGLAVTHGDPLAVAGAWLAVAAGVVAIATRTSVGSDAGTNARDVAPPTLQRLAIGGVLAQSALVVTLFAGPQVAEASDAISWAVGIGALAAVAWFGRDVRLPKAPMIAFVFGAIGLAATLVSGAP